MKRVGLLLITHDPVGRTLLETAISILGPCPLPVAALPVPLDRDPERTAAEAWRMASELDQGAGVLVLTDLYGSTPGNIACSLLEREHVRILSGLNLPMLFRIFNYPDLELERLAEKAAGGGRDGVMLVATKGK